LTETLRRAHSAALERRERGVDCVRLREPQATLVPDILLGLLIYALCFGGEVVGLWFVGLNHVHGPVHIDLPRMVVS